MPKWCRGGSIESNIYLRYSGGNTDPRYNSIAGQKLNILYRAIRSRRNNPKWMTNKLKCIIGLKRIKYKKVKAG